MKAIAAVCAMALLTACAGTITKPPTLDRTAILREQQAQQQQVVSNYLDMLERLQSIAWPVLKANADLCGKSVRPSLGLTLGDQHSISRQVRGLRRSDVPMQGVFVAAVARNSPADAAGLKAGERLRGKSVSDVGKSLDAALKKGNAVTLTRANGETLPLVPDSICAFPVKLSYNGKINALTNGRSIIFYTGLLRAVPDDAQIQMVVAHELAHALLKHPRKGMINSVISGGWLLGTVAATGGWLVDNLRDMIGQSGPVSYQSAGAQLATWPYGRAFEREADYVALYLMARSGGDIGKVEHLFDTFSRSGPRSTWLGISHPVTPERIVAVRAARSEIEAKRQRGAPLVPEGWPAAN